MIIEHIANYGRISRQEALQHYRVQNLADIIMKLRRDGWPIDKTRVEIDGQKICYYWLSFMDLVTQEVIGNLVKIDGRYEAPWED